MKGQLHNEGWAIVMNDDDTLGALHAPYTLDKLQKAVGGYIELVPVLPSWDGTGESVVVVDEEGLLKADLKPNYRASMITGQQIVGNAILMRREWLNNGHTESDE